MAMGDGRTVVRSNHATVPPLGWVSLAVVLWVFFRGNVQAALDYSYLQSFGAVSTSFGLIYVLVVMAGLAIGTVLPLFVIAFSRPLGDVIILPPRRRWQLGQA
jgi:hypothetical protein